MHFYSTKDIKFVIIYIIDYLYYLFNKIVKKIIAPS